MASITISTKAYGEGRPALRLILPFELRQRSRMLAVMDSGEEVGLMLPRGTVLRGGDRLQVSDGRLVEVVAAPEQISILRGADARTLARAAYHLGNRHVAVQITGDSLRLQNLGVPTLEPAARIIAGGEEGELQRLDPLRI